MRTILAYPGNMSQAQHIARALMEANALLAFVTTYVYSEDGALASVLARLPFDGSKRIARQLARRTIKEVPAHLVHSYPMWEMLRSGAMLVGAGPVIADRIWDRMSHSFDALVARRYVPRAQAIQGFEYTALAAFERAKKEGKATILHLPSPDNKQFEIIEQREKRLWKELVTKHDGYFDGRFAYRYERRLNEIALADVIIANSLLTARSHIQAGADPKKVFVVPLGAPPTIAEVRVGTERNRRPLNVIWAGPFSLRKGAHYLFEAWRLLAPKSSAILNVYGQVVVPDRLFKLKTGSIVFHGSVPMATLFKAYEEADVLVFPTLFDGFGLVVAEAMAHGLPVITTDQAGAAILVTADNGLIVPAADPKSLADALRWCLDNRDRLQSMRFHALETARHRQWSDFRRDLIVALETGQTRAGYSPSYNRKF
jgi:glycosyltransferase involved in cell wall biosynthesis